MGMKMVGKLQERVRVDMKNKGNIIKSIIFCIFFKKEVWQIMNAQPKSRHHDFLFVMAFMN